MTRGDIRIGTRGSALALAQARLVADAFESAGRPARLVVVETEGDRRAPDMAWGEGAFVAAIEHSLLARKVDVAVHSAKDVPTEEDPRLMIAAYLERADPRDALVVRAGETSDIDALAPGSRIGTDSPRRTGFLRARRPDLSVHPLHGNVDTRLRRLDEGETDGLILACAGLDRLGLGSRIAQRLGPDVLPPAPGQGVLAVQVRRDDAPMTRLARRIDHPRTRAEVEVERAFLVASGGGCRSPIGALATTDGDEMDLVGGYANPDGSSATITHRRGPRTAALALARDLAAELRPHRPRPMQAERRVLVTRASGQTAELAAALRRASIDPVFVPAIAIDYGPSDEDLKGAVGHLAAYAWVVVTSTNGARALLAAAERASVGLDGPRWAALGSATQHVLEGTGVEVGYRPRRSTSTALAVGLPVEAGDRVLVVRGNLASREMVRILRTRGAEVDDIVAYRTREAPESSRDLLRQALNGPIDAVLFTSGSTVRGLVTLARAEGLNVASLRAICIGPNTALHAARAGFSILVVSPAQEAGAMAEVTAQALASQAPATQE